MKHYIFCYFTWCDRESPNEETLLTQYHHEFSHKQETARRAYSVVMAIENNFHTLIFTIMILMSDLVGLFT